MKKNIIMKKTQQGSENGIAVNTYEAGTSYNMEESLASVFIDQGWAVEAEETPADPPDADETKGEPGPSNATEPGPENTGEKRTSKKSRRKASRRK